MLGFGRKVSPYVMKRLKILTTCCHDSERRMHIINWWGSVGGCGLPTSIATVKMLNLGRRCSSLMTKNFRRFSKPEAKVVLN